MAYRPGAFRSIALTCALALSSSYAEETAPDSGGMRPEDIRVIAEVLDRVKSDYYKPVDDQMLLRKALTAFLGALDPYSKYLSPKDMERLRGKAAGKEVGSVGLEIQAKNNAVRVIAPIDGSPAAEAGIVSGELIVKIDGAATEGFTTEEIVDQLRGPIGSEVELTLADPKSSATRRVSIARASVIGGQPSVSLPFPGTSLIRVSQFSSQTASAIRHRLASLEASDRQRIILDLRNNPGGLLNGCIDTANLFLPPGAPIATLRGRSRENNRAFVASAISSASELQAVPMVVLINGGTAAGSEIVAAALHENHRAALIGTKTFGSGTVQTILPLVEGGAIKFTTAEWSTPDGHAIENAGITPDIVSPDEDSLKASKRLFDTATE